MKINNVPGDLTDISAKKEALCARIRHFFEIGILISVLQFFRYVTTNKGNFPDSVYRQRHPI